MEHNFFLLNYTHIHYSIREKNMSLQDVGVSLPRAKESESQFQWAGRCVLNVKCINQCTAAMVKKVPERAYSRQKSCHFLNIIKMGETLPCV